MKHFGATRAGAIVLALALTCTGTVAQDDIDLDSLLDELSDVPAAPTNSEVTRDDTKLDGLLNEVEEMTNALAVPPAGTDMEAAPSGEAAQEAPAEEPAPEELAPPVESEPVAEPAEAVAEEEAEEPLAALEDLMGELDAAEAESEPAAAEEAPAESAMEMPAETTPEMAAEMPPEMAEETPEEMPEELAAEAPEEQPATSEAAEPEDIFAELMGETPAEEEEPAVAEEAESGEALGLEELLGGDEEAGEQAPAEVVEEEGGEAASAEEAAAAEAETQSALAESEGISMTEAAELMAKQEKVRLAAKEQMARSQLDAGFAALAEKKYHEAAEAFEKALDLPVRPKTEEARQRALFGYGEAKTALARELFRAATREEYVNRSELEEAHKHLMDVLRVSPEHAGALRLRPKIERELARPARTIPVKDREDIVELHKNIDQLLSEARQYFDIGDYNEAEKLFEQVLFEDEYNVYAMRYLKRIEERRYKFSSRKRDKTAADLIQDVRDAWSPPPGAFGEIPETFEPRKPVDTGRTPAALLQEKMESIIIPSLEFRQANITDVINLLVEASREGDPDKIGVNIILHVAGAPAATGSAGTGAQPATRGTSFDTGGGLEDIFNEEPTFSGGGGTSASSDIPTITLNLRRVNLLDAIRYVTEVAGLKYRLDQSAIIITPANVVTGTVVTRLYPVRPSLIETVIEKQQTDTRTAGADEFEFGFDVGSRTEIKKSDVKAFFEEMGVPFPVGTSIAYNPAISKLIVANTPENHDRLERVLADINVTPSQIEIEARFVEIVQSDLDELGFEWSLTDNYEIATKQGSGVLASTERIQIDANAANGGVTRGLRFFGEGATGVEPATFGSTAVTSLGDILSFSSVLTNPELNVVLHALSQSGHADVLSAPKVTTRSGQNATIQVVREIIYPSEFTSEATRGDSVRIVTTAEGNEQLTGGNIVIFPDEFETRGVGVILNVTPTVGPDGVTIDLALAPEVSEFVTWIEYGTPPQVVPQPVFESRNVTTSIDIWDGETVVLGGLIREELVTIDDKVPILGDIPLVGRLFRNKGEQSQKQNLLIFVTARLVRPDGRPLHTADELRGRHRGGTEEAVATP